MCLPTCAQRIEPIRCDGRQKEYVIAKRELEHVKEPLRDKSAASNKEYTLGNG